MNARDWAILLTLSVLWGGSFFFIEIAVETVTPLTLVFVRVAMAAAVLWLFLRLRGQRLELPAGTAVPFLVLAFLNNVLPFGLFAWAQQEIAGGLASILNATTPMWSVIVGHVFTADEKVTPGKVAGVLLGFGGVAFIIGPDVLSEIGTGFWAQLACLVAAASYAFAGVYGKRFHAMGIPAVSITTGQFAAAAALLLPIVLLFEPPWQASAPAPEAWMAMTALALFCTCFAYVLFFKLLASAGATNTLLVTFLIPITAILLGALFLGEVLEPRHVAGMALIGAGLAAIDGRLIRRLRFSPA